MKDGLRLFKAGRFDKAARRFAGVVKRHPDDVAARLLLATCYVKLGKNIKANLELEKVLKLDSDNGKAHYLIGVIMFKERRFEKSAKHLKLALRNENDLKEEHKTKAQRMLSFISTGAKSQTGSEESLGAQSVDSSVGEVASLEIEISDYSKLEEKYRIAIFDFADKNNKAKISGYGAVFGEMLTTAIIKTRGFEVIERDQITRVLDEQALQMSGVTENANVQKLGSLLGVDFVLIGGVSALSKVIEIDLRLIDVASGEARLADSVTAKSEDTLRQAAASIATKIDSIYKQEGK